MEKLKKHSEITMLKNANICLILETRVSIPTEVLTEEMPEVASYYYMLLNKIKA